MIISNITLRGYKWISLLGDISEISIDPKNVLQLVIGTNGSGKSSILQEISPLPAKKADYTKGGMKSVTLEHDGNNYELVSDFTTSKGEHKFLKNGYNLNVSGLSSLQVDLCREHLNYTGLTESICHCQHDIANMEVSRRKSFLFSLSPAIPSYMSKLHQLSRRALNSYTSNLKLLHSRSTEIQEKLSSLEEIEHKKLIYTYLEKKQIDVCGTIYLIQSKIKEHLDKLTRMPSGERLDEEDIRDYIRELQALRYSSGANTKVSEYPDIIQTTSIELEKFKYLETDNSSKWLEYSNQLTEYRQSLEKSKLLSDKDMYSQELMQKSDALKKLERFRKYPIIPSTNLEKHNEAIQRLYDIVTSEKYYSRGGYFEIHKLRNIEDKGLYVREHLSSLTHHFNATSKSIKEYEDRLSTVLKGPIDQRDNCSSCDYMLQHSDTRKELHTLLKRQLKCRDELAPKIDKYTRVRSRLLDKYSSLRKKLEVVNLVSETLHGTIWEMTFSETIAMLSTDVLSKIEHMQKTIQAQQPLNEIEVLEKDISGIVTKVNALESVSCPTVDILTNLIEEKESQIESLTATGIEITRNIQSLSARLLNVTKLSEMYYKGSEYDKNISEYIERAKVQDYVDYLSKEVKPIFDNMQKEIEAELRELQEWIKKQEVLYGTWKNEIEETIKRIDKQKEVMTYVEMSLSPESGMPHVHILRYINAILENANFVLSKIWTTPFQIELLKEGSEVTCDFKARVHNKVSTPLSKLSKSQKAAVNFAFYIALIYATEAYKYPVCFDECDDGFDKKHKEKYFEWVRTYIDSQYAPQIWMVCHDVHLYNMFLHKDVTCLHYENVAVPDDVNLYTTIKH